MLTTLDMLPREAPLCLRHFLNFARLYLEDLEKDKPQLSTAPRPPKKPTLPPARVQPRRAVKSKTPIYADPPKIKCKIEAEQSSDSDESSDDDAPIKRKRMRVDEADRSYEESDQPAFKKRKMELKLTTAQRIEIEIEASKLRKHVEGVALSVSESDDDCVFGSKPWICPGCEEERFTSIREFGLNPLFKRRTIRTDAYMEPSTCELLLSWEGDVPEEQGFQWQGMEFAVDACDGVMVLML